MSMAISTLKVFGPWNVKTRVLINIFVQISYPAPMDAVLTATSALKKSSRSKAGKNLWRNPTHIDDKLSNSEV